MIDYHCQSCGAPLPITEGARICECVYCGSRWSVSEFADPETLTLLKNAAELRQHYEFDRAISVYEKVAAKAPEELKAYWGIVLCKYGIVYVEDPRTGKKIPTCHRTSFNSVSNDLDYQKIVERASEEELAIYQEKSETVEGLRKNIIKVSENEQPYDVFICYKETDENNNRTYDSVDAQNIYNQLTESGYRVFFARISLKDHMGEMYEPYIFSALSSAKVMLVFGCKREYFNAVWVKNEWGRFLNMSVGKSDRRTIVCYKDMNGYDIPEELMGVQALERKLGWDQDLLDFIKKFIPKNNRGAVAGGQQSGGSPETILEFADINRKGGEFNKAKENYDKVLRIAPKNHKAYWGLFLANGGYASESALVDDNNASALADMLIGNRVCSGLTPQTAGALLSEHFGSNLNNAINFADDATAKTYRDYISQLAEKVSAFSKKVGYNNTERLVQEAETIEHYEMAANTFRELGEEKRATEIDAVVAKLRRKEHRRNKHERGMKVVGRIGTIATVLAAIAHIAIFFFMVKADPKAFTDELSFVMVATVMGGLIGMFLGVTAEVKRSGYFIFCIVISVLQFIACTVIGCIFVKSVYIGEVFSATIAQTLNFAIMSVIVAIVANLITKIVVKISSIGLYS